MRSEDDSSGFQTQTRLRAMLGEAGLVPRKRHGQHFLVDRNLMMKLVDCAEIGRGDCVLEVGAGTGSLTALLAVRAGRVVTVEIDEGLAELARANLAAFDNVRLLRVDALARKSEVAASVVAAVEEARSKCDGPLKLAANLPYDIATPLVIDLLLSDMGFSRLCFTVQAEVADRFLAKVGTADYGPVGIITRLLAAGRKIARVPPQAFWPVPKVHSVLVRLDRRLDNEIEVDEPAAFAGFVKSFFLHRRKTMSHLARQRPDAEMCIAALEQGGIALDARPEAVHFEQWIGLFRAIG
jgi:16S rRNA (adenine1518-N6/adenine1519-N6)-dimethyltransferase